MVAWLKFLVLLAATSVSQPEEDDGTYYVELALHLGGTSSDASQRGRVVIECHTQWAPLGAQRFRDLVTMRFYDDSRFFRSVPSFMAQFGAPRSAEEHRKWRKRKLPDDVRRQSNQRGYVAFATTGRDSRTTGIFINTGDNGYLDDIGPFAPFGKVVSGMGYVDGLYNGYGESAPHGNGPVLARIEADGNAYLDESFPLLGRILRAKVLDGSPVLEESPKKEL